MSWIQCECGRIIHDNSDALSYKGYLVSDREYFKLLDFCDSLIESPEPDRERLCMKLRKNLGVNGFIELRDVFQCPDCGRILIEDAENRYHSFLPEDSDSSGLLDFDGTGEPYEPHRNNDGEGNV